VFAAAAPTIRGQGVTPDKPYELLIRRLGDDEFTVREEASRKLREAHVRAAPWLSKALTNHDPEVRRRAKELWDRLGNGAELYESCPEVLQALPHMPHIQYAILSRPKDEDVAFLKQCRRLWAIDLSDSRSTVTDKCLTYLTDMPDLRRLAIRSPTLKGGGFRHLKFLDNLADVTVCAPISDEGLAAISALPNLTILRLAGADVTDEGLKYLARRRTLQLLEINGAKRITDAGILQLAEMPSSLTTPQFRDCPLLTPEGLKRFFEAREAFLLKCYDEDRRKKMMKP
jgi:hypothetical protein